MADTPATSSPSNPNPDYFTAAGTNIDQAKAQTLADVAQYGSQAKQQFAQAQQANQDAMTNAVKQALAFSVARGAPGSDQSALQGQVQAPFNERGADLAASLASRSASLGEAASANGNYFDQLKAALPALQAGTQQKVAALQAAVAAKQAAAASKNDPGSIIRSLGGAAAAGDAIDAAGQRIAGPNGTGATQADTSWTDVPGGRARGLAASNASLGGEVSLPDAEEQVGSQLGLAPGQGSALASAASTAAQRAGLGLSNAQVNAAQPGHVYANAYSDYAGLLSKGQSPDQAYQNIVSVYGKTVADTTLGNYVTSGNVTKR